MKSRSFIPLGLVASIALLAAAAAGAQERPGAPQPTPEQRAELERAARAREVANQPGPAPQTTPVRSLLPVEPLPTVPLADVLERVARNSNKQFLVDFRTPQRIFLGGARIEDVSYPILLSILRNNALAAT